MNFYKKKVFILGCGKMGEAHLASFLKKKNSYDIYIFDKRSTIKKLIKKYAKYNLIFLHNLPKNMVFDLVIIATESIERFNFLKIVLSKNIVDVLLLEKFLFQNKKEYILADKYIKINNTKAFVNCWGSNVARISKLEKLNKKNNYIVIKVKIGNFLTNLIHILDLIYYLEKDFNFKSNFVISDIFKSKSKKYREVKGNLTLQFQKTGNFYDIRSAQQDSIFEIFFNNLNKLILNPDLNLNFFFNGTMHTNIFPKSSNYTEKIYSHHNKKNFIYKFLDYDIAKKFSIFILNSLKKASAQKILIR